MIILFSVLLYQWQAENGCKMVWGWSGGSLKEKGKEEELK